MPGSCELQNFNICELKFFTGRELNLKFFSIFRYAKGERPQNVTNLTNCLKTKLTKMKTLKDLFEVMAEATAQNQSTYRTWFIDYSGHVNLLSVKFYLTGWGVDGSNSCQKLDQKLDEDGIQVAYYWIKTRLN